MRRAAKILNIHRVTVARKLEFLSKNLPIKVQNGQYVQSMCKAHEQSVQHVQFDDLITIEHTKCKPLAVSMAIERYTRRILGFEVSTIPAFGNLAAIAKQKYGQRTNEKAQGWHKLFSRLEKIVSPTAQFDSDEDHLYPSILKKHFPQGKHHRYKGLPAKANGLGELKKAFYDPLFDINHSFAMLRANVNRLVRKTWCTTKKKSRLIQHLTLYQHYHNTQLV
jgi:hypothetical protein